MKTVFWDDKVEKPITMDRQVFAQEAEVDKLTGMLCVDGFNTNPEMRYGQFIYQGGWKHTPLSDFPPLFRTHLLLLNIA